MGIFNNLFKKSHKNKTTTPKTQEQIIQQALANQGIVADTIEISELINRLWNSINFKLVFPELLDDSRTASMTYKDSIYSVTVSMSLTDGAGHISENALKMIMSCAVYWACVSEIAKARGEVRLTLKSGDRIAICDHTGFYSHPIYVFFPELLNKTV